MDCQLEFINFSSFLQLLVQHYEAALIPLMECAYHLGLFLWHWLMLPNCWGKKNRKWCLAIAKYNIRGGAGDRDDAQDAHR